MFRFCGVPARNVFFRPHEGLAWAHWNSRKRHGFPHHRHHQLSLATFLDPRHRPASYKVTKPGLKKRCSFPLISSSHFDYIIIIHCHNKVAVSHLFRCHTFFLNFGHSHGPPLPSPCQRFQRCFATVSVVFRPPEGMLVNM